MARLRMDKFSSTSTSWKENLENFSGFSMLFVDILVIGYMLATYEHSYWTLKQFSAGEIFFGINVSQIAMFALVLAIDLTIYFMVYYIPQAKLRDISINGPVTLLVLVIVISMFLNVKYMIANKPTAEDSFHLNLIIAFVIGLLIPLALGVLGYIRSLIVVYAQTKEAKKTTKEEAAEQKIRGGVVDEQIERTGGPQPDIWAAAKEIGGKAKLPHKSGAESVVVVRGGGPQEKPPIVEKSSIASGGDPVAVVEINAPGKPTATFPVASQPPGPPKPADPSRATATATITDGSRAVRAPQGSPLRGDSRESTFEPQKTVVKPKGQIIEIDGVKFLKDENNKLTPHNGEK